MDVFPNRFSFPPSAPRYRSWIAFLHHPYFCGDLIQSHVFKSLPPTSPLNCLLDISIWISNRHLILTRSQTEQMIPHPQICFYSSIPQFSKRHPDTQVQTLESPLIPFFISHPSSNLSASKAKVTWEIQHVSDLSLSPSPYDSRLVLSNRNIM